MKLSILISKLKALEDSGMGNADVWISDHHLNNNPIPCNIKNISALKNVNKIFLESESFETEQTNRLVR